MIVLEYNHFATILTITPESSVEAKTSQWKFVED